MDNAGYTTLTRQAGLLREMASVANNLANMSTTGYRREGVVFSEYIQDLGRDAPSLSMASGGTRALNLTEGALQRTSAPFDLAIEGEGFFLVATPDGDRLTRNGSFAQSPTGELLTNDGYPLLDAGGTPVFAPPDARAVSIAPDGTLSADGQPLAQIGLWQPVEATDLTKAEGVMFSAPGGVAPATEPGAILQGFLEGSNVQPVAEVTRMIEVQRAYELGQGFLDREDERIRSVLRTLGR